VERRCRRRWFETGGVGEEEEEGRGRGGSKLSSPAILSVRVGVLQICNTVALSLLHGGLFAAIYIVSVCVVGVRSCIFAFSLEGSRQRGNGNILLPEGEG